MFHLPTLLLGLLAFALVRANRVVHRRLVRALRVPRRPVAQLVAMALTAALAIATLTRPFDLVGYTLAALALFGAGRFLFVAFRSRLPAKRLIVTEGQPAPDFTAIDADGRPFQLSSLAGQPVLLKFYRGHW